MARSRQKARTISEPHEPSWKVQALVLALALAAWFILTIANVRATSPTVDEGVHLVAGYSYLKWSDFRLNSEHPPLSKILAALFLTGADVWPRELGHDPRGGDRMLTILRDEWETSPTTAALQWNFSQHLLYALRDEPLQRIGGDPMPARAMLPLSRNDYLNDVEHLFARARLASVFAGALLLVLVYSWARELFGSLRAMLALALCLFEPNLIAHSGLVTSDVPLTTFFFGAIYFTWRCTRRLSHGNFAGLAGFLVLAILTKFSGVILVPIVVFLLAWKTLSSETWHVEWPLQRELANRKEKALAAVAIVFASGVISYAALWGIYDFRYSAFANGKGELPTRVVLEEWATRKAIHRLYPDGIPDDVLARERRRTKIPLAGNLILSAAKLHVAPESYLFGWSMFLASGVHRHSYLRGEYTLTGFPDYFFWTTLFKTPLPTLALIVLGIFAVASGSGGASRTFLVLPILLYGAAAAGSNTNIGHRHILPIVPFLLLVAATAFLRWETLRPRLRAATAAVTTIAIAATSLFVFSPPWRPVSMYGAQLAYFNEVSGGPDRASRQLVDSNLDWGQDLPRLKRWLDERNIDEPINFCYFGMADPKYWGIRYLSMPLGNVNNVVNLEDARVPGYFAISETHWRGTTYERQDRRFWPEALANAKFIGRAGHSILIFHKDR